MGCNYMRAHVKKADALSHGLFAMHTQTESTSDEVIDVLG